MDIELGDNIKELIKLNIEKDLTAFGCKNIDEFLCKYSNTIIEALEEVYIIELEYLQDKITQVNEK